MPESCFFNADTVCLILIGMLCWMHINMWNQTLIFRYLNKYKSIWWTGVSSGVCLWIRIICPVYQCLCFWSYCGCNSLFPVESTSARSAGTLPLHTSAFVFAAYLISQQQCLFQTRLSALSLLSVIRRELKQRAPSVRTHNGALTSATHFNQEGFRGQGGQRGKLPPPHPPRPTTKHYTTPLCSSHGRVRPVSSGLTSLFLCTSLVTQSFLSLSLYSSSMLIPRLSLQGSLLKVLPHAQKQQASCQSRNTHADHSQIII